MTAAKLHAGGCHCGNVRFEVEADLEAVVSCNCSICARRGSLLWAVPRGSVRVQVRDGGMAEYLFNQHVFRHRFCRTCGIHPFAEDAHPAGANCYVNVRCLDQVDLATLHVIGFDGRAV